MSGKIEVQSHDYKGFLIVQFVATGECLVHAAPEAPVLYQASDITDAMVWVNKAVAEG